METPSKHLSNHFWISSASIADLLAGFEGRLSEHINEIHLSVNNLVILKAI
jgi:hypothetical protein